MIKTKNTLPWSQLSHRKFRLAVALLGVAFSNILIFSQLGLRALLFDGIKIVPNALEGDLYLVSAFSATIDGSSIPKIFLNRALAIPEVAEVAPLYISKEYATLKAIGYSDVSLLLIILQQTILLGILGFVPGIVSSYWVYTLLRELTKIPLAMRPDIIVRVFVLTLIMCSIAGAMATNKLRSADPAEIF